jgi:predicted ATPase
VDGVWFVDLAPISDAELVITTMVQTLGLKEIGEQPPLEQLKAYLRDKHLLLVLDNFEQVVDAAGHIAQLLAAAPRLKVLVTSRVVLRLRGEQEYGVPSLALPNPKQLPPLEALSQYAAVELFIQRARDVKPDFQVTNANAPAVAEICARLDGLPLAIELAAARVKLFTTEALLKRLERRLSVLTGGPRDVPARQQTIRAAIDWSYELLDAGEKRLFARLGVFVGGCTLEAAEVVCNADGDLPVEVVDGIAVLMDQSLVRQIEGPDGEPRFMMLETIREYVLERLDASGEAHAIWRQHAHFFLALAEEAEPKLYGTEQRAWLDRLRAEHDNLRAALTWSHSTGEAELGMRLAEALGRFWYIRGLFGEGRRWLEEVLAQGSAASPVVRARALSWVGTFASGQSDMTIASVMFESSIALFRAAGDTQGLANALGALGWMAFDQGNYPLAQACAEEGVELCRDVGDKQGLAGALTLSGYIADGLGDEMVARASADESLALFHDIGDNWNLAGPLSILGNVARRQGDYITAQVRYEEGLALWRETGDKVGMAWGLRNLGAVARAQGNAAWAAALFAESLVIERELGYKPYTALCLEGLAWVAGERGQPERATRLLGAAEALRAGTGACIPPVDRADYAGVVAATRAQLDDTTFAAAQAEGRAMPLEQAIADALDQAPPSPN